MIDNILHGIGATSSRSGSSTSSRSGSASSVTVEKPQTYTFPDGTSVSLTPSQYAQTPFPKWLDIYNQCYKIANSRNLTSPKWSDIQQFGDAVLQSYQSGKAFDANAYKAQLEASQKKTYTLPDGSQRQLTKAEYDSLIAAYNEYQAAQYAAYQAEQQAKAAAEAAAQQAAAEKAAAEAAAQQAAAQQADTNRIQAALDNIESASEKAQRSVNLALTTPSAELSRQFLREAEDDVNIFEVNFSALKRAYEETNIDGSSSLMAYSARLQELQRMIANMENTQSPVVATRMSNEPPEVVLPSTIPAGVQPIDTTEDKGSGFPWLAAALFAAIGIGAIALSKSKPKKKRR